jgi:hypothetical protein
MRRVIRPESYWCSQLVVQPAHATGLRPLTNSQTQTRVTRLDGAVIDLTE